jgi:lactoylglutathione lyase
MSSRSSTAARRSAGEADWWLGGSDRIVGEPTVGFKEDHRMKRVTLFKVFVHDQDEALDFYTKKLGFEVAEDNKLGEYRWLLVRLPDNKEFCLNLDIPRTEEQKALVGRQSADLPLFSIETDDCMGDYKAMKARGVEFEGEPVAQSYGTGCAPKRPLRQQDLHEPGLKLGTKAD